MVAVTPNKFAAWTVNSLKVDASGVVGVGEVSGHPCAAVVICDQGRATAVRPLEFNYWKGADDRGINSDRALQGADLITINLALIGKTRCRSQAGAEFRTSLAVEGIAHSGPQRWIAMEPMFDRTPKVIVVRHLDDV